MQPDFWIEKWQGLTQGFNQTEPTPLLVKHFLSLNLPKNSTVFVPLCGKSIDMVWLAEQGYHIVGCELVDSVVQSFFSEQDIEVNPTKPSEKLTLTCYQGTLAGQNMSIWAGDIFDLTAADIGSIDAIFDRAALVAMPQGEGNNMRARYTQHLIELAFAPQFLITLGLVDDDESLYSAIPGPPFFITTAQLAEYYGNDYDIDLIAQNEEVKRTSKGRSWVNLAWGLTPKNSYSQSQII